MERIGRSVPVTTTSETNDHMILEGEMRSSFIYNSSSRKQPYGPTSLVINGDSPSNYEPFRERKSTQFNKNFADSSILELNARDLDRISDPFRKSNPSNKSYDGRKSCRKVTLNTSTESNPTGIILASHVPIAKEPVTPKKTQNQSHHVSSLAHFFNVHVIWNITCISFNSLSH